MNAFFICKKHIHAIVIKQIYTHVNNVVIDVNKYIVCNEIETSVTNVNFKYDFNMLNILYVNCCRLVNKLHYPEFENLIEKHNTACFVETTRKLQQSCERCRLKNKNIN
jgi:hypothetical protein